LACRIGRQIGGQIGGLIGGLIGVPPACWMALTR